MKRIIPTLLFPITVSVSCAIGLEDSYTSPDDPTAIVSDTDDARKKPDSGGGSGDDVGSGDIVTSPGIQLGLPDDDYIVVNNMNTSGLGTSQDATNIIGSLQDALDANTDENDLMHWYVSGGVNVDYCTPNSFRCDYDNDNGNRTSVVMALWLPQNAQTITLNFSSYSRGMSISLWTYDYENKSMLLHYEGNNVFNNPKAPGESFDFSQTYTSESTNGAFTGHYLLVMFNSAEKEKDWIDINGLGVSYSVEALDDDYVISPRTNPFQPEVGTNIVGDTPAVPEPSVGILSLLGLAGLATRRRRK
ncbi:MAG: PEP-CTERM sorting domain-containing protein [Akkermansia sp.]|nr:PEP-CTERM sorting domain-containing protein [Akkermansia sp.]